MKKIIFVPFVLMMGLFSCFSIYAQNTTQEKPLKEVSGTVVTKDWVAGMLIVDTGGDEITFYVPRSAKITKGTHDSSFSEINVGDYVTLKYCDMCFVGLEAVNITDKIAIRSSES